MKSNLSQITRREFIRISALSVGGLLTQSSLSFSDGESRDLGEWKKLSDMPTSTGRFCVSASVIDGKLYIVGGLSYRRFGIPDYYGELEVYDPKTDKWEKKADMLPPERIYFGTGVINEKLYVVGGLTRRGDSLSLLDVYDPKTDKWFRSGNIIIKSDRFPENSKNDLGIGVIDGKLYAVSGIDSYDHCDYLSQKLHVYDPKTNIWNRLQDSPTPRASLGVEVIDGKLYVVGGRNTIGRYTDYQASVLSTLEVYDPKTDKWSKLRDMPTAKEYFGTGVIDGKLYVVGGRNGRKIFSSIEVYDPKTDRWRKLADTLTARCVTGSGVIDGKLYVAGGLREQGTLREHYSSNILEVFTPPKRLLVE